MKHSYTMQIKYNLKFITKNKKMLSSERVDSGCIASMYKYRRTLFYANLVVPFDALVRGHKTFIYIYLIE
jgi:hypothetical protein